MIPQRFVETRTRLPYAPVTQPHHLLHVTVRGKKNKVIRKFFSRISVCNGCVFDWDAHLHLSFCQSSTLRSYLLLLRKWPELTELQATLGVSVAENKPSYSPFRQR